MGWGLPRIGLAAQRTRPGGRCDVTLRKKPLVPSDVQKSRDTWSPGLGLAIRGLMSTSGSGKLKGARGTTRKRECRSRLVARAAAAAADGVEEWNESGTPDVLQSDTDSRADGVKGDEKDYDAGKTGGDGGGGRGKSNGGGGGNDGGDNVGDNNANDGIPWWWLLCTAASGTNSSSRNEQSLVTAGFVEGSFDVIGRAIVLATRGPLFELARAGLVSSMLYLYSEPFEATIMGILFGIIGLPITLVGLADSWLWWKWRGHPIGGEQQEEEEGDDDDHNLCLD